jgi:site-specific DNA-methyltransferase (adenine-specific)
MSETEWVSIDDLVPWDKNPRDNQHAVEAVAKSITRFGWGSPILARRADRVVIAGHTRLKAAQSLGLDQVLVRWMDLDPATAAAMALADNRLGEIAEWSDGLADVLRELEAEDVDLAGLGWSDDELAALLAEPESEIVDEVQDVPEVDERAPPDSVLGGVYELGPHRLVCGDSTSTETWAALMGEEKARMVWTDPPYGVAYVGGTSDALTIQNDNLDEAGLKGLLRDALGMTLAHTVQGAAWYVAAPAMVISGVFGDVLRELEVWRHTLIWLKDRFALGRADYHYRHEPIFYGWTPGAAHYFVDDRTQDSVLEVPRPSRNAEHPTMKPVDLVRRCIRNSSQPGWLVVEPFGGSGTTLIAAATERRIARVIELDPRYCDVIRRRWTRFALENKIDPGPGALDG